MQIEEQVSLARFTTLGTGGPARAFARPSTLAELTSALAWAAERGLDVAVVGLGSNRSPSASIAPGRPSSAASSSHAPSRVRSAGASA